MRRFALLIVIALVAAACGGGASSNEFRPQTTADSGTDSTLESLDSGASGEPMPETTTSTTSTSVQDTTDSTEPVIVPDSDFPDIVVTDLAGGEVNLRELALEENPVLLWFWAPH